MKIEREITITIPTEEASDIIKQHFIDKGYNISKVHYRIEQVGGDFMDRYPGTDTVTSVIVSGKEGVSAGDGTQKLYIFSVNNRVYRASGVMSVEGACAELKVNLIKHSFPDNIANYIAAQAKNFLLTYIESDSVRLDYNFGNLELNVGKY